MYRREKAIALTVGFVPGLKGHIRISSAPPQENWSAAAERQRHSCKSTLRPGTKRPDPCDLRQIKEVRDLNTSDRIPIMRRATVLNLPRFIAMVLIALQAVMPGTVAIAQPNAIDFSRYLCAPSDELSPESRAAVEQIAILLGEAPPGAPHSGDHCQMCTLAHGAPLPKPVTVDAPVFYPREHIFVRFQPGLIRKAQGPPLGSRGPPSPL